MESRKIISFIAVLSVFFLSVPQVRADYFTDINANNKYFQAIEFLAANGFITGYPDKTFQSDRMVNRAEFLKLVMSVTSTPTDIAAPSDFPDVDNNSWYAPYVRKALALGWVQGYEDNTFKPERYISKAEGIKIISKASGWIIPSSVDTEPYNDVPTDAWFAAYISYAKEHNFLEE
jgi:hypothetical protein